jgi:hypothetical protein
MSHQPSTVDNIKAGANEAYESITGTLDPSQQQERPGSKKHIRTDDQGQPCEKGDFKDQLNQAAQGSGRSEDDVKEPSYIEKGTCIPVFPSQWLE